MFSTVMLIAVRTSKAQGRCENEEGLGNWFGLAFCFYKTNP